MAIYCMKTLKNSPFANTYGGLRLVENDKGQRLLEMEDCFGSDYFGPLTDEQVEAFEMLCDVERA